ncbi:MAG: restriction endonuclease subunit S [Sideroxyarcus sp.]|nr:restriction endonuclease subunit S [Sideroxyarcus sp.]
MPEVITDNLDLWTSALRTRSTAGRGSNSKLEAYGIKKLRELILELAVRGKLLPQDPNDEPASALLKKIAKEKLRLVKEWKIRKEKLLPEIAEEEMDYELPSGWVFVRLGDVAYSQAGFAFKSNFFNESSDGLPLIRIRDVGQPFTGTFYSGEYREEFLVEKGDYLISMDGEFRVSPWTNGSALLNQRVSRLIFYYENVGQRFIADSLQARLRELQGVKAYTTVDHLSGTQITEAVIGLPPLAEQHRIVTKVDELMALCDQLEQHQTHSLEAHQTLVASLLGTLTRVESQQEFGVAWARIASHFDTLFTTEASIDQLKPVILDLAVKGLLVKQVVTSTSVENCLKNKDISERSKINLGKGVEASLDKEIDQKEMAYKLPRSWRWVRLGKVVEISGGSQPPKSKFIYEPRAGYTQLIQIRDFKSDDYPTYVPNEFANRPFSEDDIMIGRYGPPVFQILRGKKGTYNVALMKADPIGGCISNNYLFYLLSEPRIQNLVIGESERTAGQSGVRKELLYMFCIGLPPIEEQHRIVAKVDELMALCDALKARLTDAQTIQLHLADAIVEQAVC